MSTPFERARAALWPTLKAQGALKTASTVLAGCTEITYFDVAFARPTMTIFESVRSSDYEIEYQHQDAPTLAEGAEVVVDGIYYRVRETPRVDPDRGDDGFWRQALLTELR
jgi:hypothetical protein